MIRRDRGPGTDKTMTESPTQTPNDTAPRSLFSVDGLAPAERYDAWKESASCIFDVDAALEDQGPDFFASVEAQMFGQVMLARTSTVKQTWQRSAARVAHYDMDHFMIQLYVDGDMAIDDGKQRRFECRNINGTVNTFCQRDVVEGVLRFQFIQKPDALLGKG